MPFEKGICPNPRGRPRLVDMQRKQTPNAKLRNLLKKLEKNLPDAVDKMVALMQDVATPATVQMSAAKTILSEYKEIYQMLEAAAKTKVDDEELSDDLPLAPVVDFTTIVQTKQN